MRAKMQYAALKMKNSKLSMGFHTWKDFALLSEGERAQYEINELRWKLRYTWMQWMRDKIQYEVTGFAKYQTQRLFGNWKNVTHGVSRVVQKVHLILGTMHRLKKQ